MSVFLRGEELIKMAINWEEAGYQFYRNTEMHTSSQKLRDLFDYLAGQELRHKEKFIGLSNEFKESFRDKQGITEEEQTYIEAMVDSSLFLRDQKRAEAVKKASTEKEVISNAIQFEKDSLLFFFHLIDLVGKTQKPVIVAIINEEKSHVRKLAALNKSI